MTELKNEIRIQQEDYILRILREAVLSLAVAEHQATMTTKQERDDLRLARFLVTEVMHATHNRVRDERERGQR